MLKQAQPITFASPHPKPLIGSLGHLAIFLWALGMVLLTTSASRSLVIALLTLGVLTLMYPAAFQRLARLRWLLIFGSLFLINVFLGATDEAPNLVILGLPVSSPAIFTGIQMTLRAAVILLAADGLSSSVNIMEVAGLLERGGLRGLGFSIGVATNLLPDLRQSSMNAWHSLRMRGGLRSEWWRGIQLLVLTIFSNALRHAGQIVLAAEVRAFRPELSRKASIRSGTMDWGMAIGFVILGAILIFGAA